MIPITEPSAADAALGDARTLRPDWLRASSPPRWFRAREFDVLDKSERRRLYGQTAAAFRVSPWLAWVMLLVWSPKLVDKLAHDPQRWLWAGGTALYVLLILGARMLRRRAIVNVARRSVREAPDWPLRNPVA